MDFFGDVGIISEYIESYIYPEYYHEDYANELGVKLQDIQKVNELCSKPDLKKETLKLKMKEVDIVSGKSISLQNKSNSNKL